jgi:hypothetical protein
MKTFKELYENVGTDVQDTSSAMATIIKRYINRRYKQICRAINFDIINDDYTIAVSAGDNSYDLPDDFKVEVACIDSTNGKALTREDFGYFQRISPTDISSTGSVDKYIIFNNDEGQKVIRLINTPSQAITIALPYIVMPKDLSLDADTPIFEVDDLLEVGATADAWRYKRQMAKAQQYEMMFNSMFADFIWSQENNPIQPKQFTPTTFNQSGLY